MKTARLILLVLAVALLADPRTAPAQQQPPLTLRQLAAKVGELRARIKDLTVSFTYDATTPGSGTLFAKSHQRIIVKGDKLSIDHEYSAPELNAGPWHVLTTYDGYDTFVHNSSPSVPHPDIAIQTGGRQSGASTRGTGFFDLMMFNPASRGRSGSSDMDLHSVLVSWHSVLRPQREDVAGHQCYVVDETEAGRPSFTAWIDPDRGFLPIRQVYWNMGTGKPLMQFDIDTAAEIQPGLWCPMEGRKHLYMGRVSEYAMIVDGYAQGAPQLSIDSGVDDSVFDLRRSLPPNVRFLVVRRNFLRAGIVSWTGAGVACLASLVIAAKWIRRLLRARHSGVPGLVPPSLSASH